MQAEAISLYFKDARSDKEYHVQLQPQGEGWMVRYQNGPRGGTLASGSKTAEPVTYDKAKKVYDKVVKEKISKGYSPGEAGTAFAHTELAGRVSGLALMLLNLASADDVENCLRSPDWVLQEKYDGDRRPVLAKEGELVGVNRRGLIRDLPAKPGDLLVAALGGVPAEFAVDCELVGQQLVVFDVLMLPGQDLRPLPYRQRLEELAKLEALIARARPQGAAANLMVVPTFYTEADKRKALADARARRAEGVVFKRLDAPYEGGKPASGGPALKMPFRHRATFLVDAQHPTKRSISLALLDGEGRRVGVGNCTIPPNYAVPAPGELAEVEYLYAFVGGSVYQPQYKGTRDDIEPHACLMSQLVFKPVGCEDDEQGAEPGEEPAVD